MNTKIIPYVYWIVSCFLGSLIYSIKEYYFHYMKLDKNIYTYDTSILYVVFIISLVLSIILSIPYLIFCLIVYMNFYKNSKINKSIYNFKSKILLGSFFLVVFYSIISCLNSLFIGAIEILLIYFLISILVVLFFPMPPAGASKMP